MICNIRQTRLELYYLDLKAFFFLVRGSVIFLFGNCLAWFSYRILIGHRLMPVLYEYQGVALIIIIAVRFSFMARLLFKFLSPHLSLL